MYDVLLQRIPRGDGAYIWKFSGATVADIQDLYKEYGYGPFERAFPAFLFDVSLMGIHLWMWLLAIVMGIALYPVAILITRSAIYVLSYFNSDLAQSISRFFAGPMQLLLWTVLGEVHPGGRAVSCGTRCRTGPHLPSIRAGLAAPTGCRLRCPPGKFEP